MNKDIEILNLIIKYANEVEEVIKNYNLDYDKFISNYVMKNTISMSILQIEENTKKLSKELRKKYNKIPWILIGDMRNRFAHGYDTMNLETIWEVASEDVSSLKLYCIDILREEKI